MKLKLTNQQVKDMAEARYFFDIGNLKRCNEILKEIHPLLNDDKLGWHHASDDDIRKSTKDYIVTKFNGHLKESNRLILHPTQEQAATYGKETYGYGEYKIELFNKWKNSQAGKFYFRKQKFLAKLQHCKPPTHSPPTPPSEKPAMKQLDTVQKHQLKVARQTLKLHDSMVRVMGGMTKPQAIEIIKQLTGKKPTK